MGNFPQHQQPIKNLNIKHKIQSFQIIFKPQTQQKQINSSLKQKLFIFGYSPIWRICKYLILTENRDFIKKNFIHAFSLIQTCRVRQLYLLNNQHCSIIKNVVQIKFPQLSILNISGNKIVSLQFLNYLQSSKLISLTLCDNQIVKARGLVKCNFVNLLFLNLQDNLIKDLQVLSKLKSKQLYELRIIVFFQLSFIDDIKIREKKKESMQQNQVQWIAKVESRQIQKIFIKGQQDINLNDPMRSYDYILQPKQIRMIKKRFYSTFYSSNNFEDDIRWM